MDPADLSSRLGETLLGEALSHSQEVLLVLAAGSVLMAGYLGYTAARRMRVSRRARASLDRVPDALLALAAVRALETASASGRGPWEIRVDLRTDRHAANPRDGAFIRAHVASADGVQTDASGHVLPVLPADLPSRCTPSMETPERAIDRMRRFLDPMINTTLQARRTLPLPATALTGHGRLEIESRAAVLSPSLPGRAPGAPIERYPA